MHNTDDTMKIKLGRLCIERSTIHWFNLWRDSEGKSDVGQYETSVNVEIWRHTL